MYTTVAKREILKHQVLSFLASKLNSSEFRVNNAIAPPGMTEMGRSDFDCESMKGTAATIFTKRFEAIASALRVIERIPLIRRMYNTYGDLKKRAKATQNEVE